VIFIGFHPDFVLYIIFLALCQKSCFYSKSAQLFHMSAPLFVLCAFNVIVHQEEHLACKKLSDEVLVWLSVWSKVQMICIWSS